MTRIEESLVFRLYRRGKVWLNYLLDRVIDLCDLFLMDVYRLPWSTAQNTARRIARCVGDIACLLRSFPRLSAYRLEGPQFTIVFVGTDQGLLEIGHLFFPEEEIQPQEIGRIALWRLSRRARQLLSEGRADLVICELSRIHPRRPQAPISFTVPVWVQQSLTIPEPLKSLISGKRYATERHRLNKARHTGFGYTFSQSRTDFDHFHYHMYLPYVTTRHDGRALTARYEHQWRRWFVKGGVVLVTQYDKPVAGVLCYIVGDTCFDIERGVLEADPKLFRQGIETMITWYAIDWAHQHGAKTYNMGGSRGWRSSGSFNSKRRWGARVVRRRRIYRTWTFLGQELCSALQGQLDELGFISEIDGRFYGVMLSSVPASAAEIDVDRELSAARDQGLDGLVVISANCKPVIHEYA